MQGIKPLGRKSYGSIAHLPNSRLGPGEHRITDGQNRIATVKKRDKHDVIIVQEKLDGSNVSVALKDNSIFPLTRGGYIANTSPYEMHHMFYRWVFENQGRFRDVLRDGERVCGEWLTRAHGTRYRLLHEPFVVFDLFDKNNKRILCEDLYERTLHKFIKPYIVSWGDPLSTEQVLSKLGTYGFHGAIDPVEGAVWRVERKGVVDFMCKYVRPEKIDGCYLDKELLNEWL